MEEYYFLFFLAFVYTLFASIQDLRKREVANWLNFSFLAFALAYRIFYSVIKEENGFLLYGLFGLGIFWILSYVFYYGKVFAGGDAKLLMSFGLIMPYQNSYDLIFVSIGFLISLFLFGAIYSLVYSSVLALKNRKRFYKEFLKAYAKKKFLLYISMVVSLLLIFQIVISGYYDALFILGFVLIFFMPLLYIYLLAIEKSCMIVLTNPKDLTPGDWIENDIRFGKVTINKSVHGLSSKEIEILRKKNKSVFIKQGVPFVPAFLFSFIFMVFFYLFLKLDFQKVFFSLF